MNFLRLENLLVDSEPCLMGSFCHIDNIFGPFIWKLGQFFQILLFAISIPLVHITLPSPGIIMMCSSHHHHHHHHCNHLQCVSYIFIYFKQFVAWEASSVLKRAYWGSNKPWDHSKCCTYCLSFMYLITVDKIHITSLCFTCFRVNI